MTIKYNRFALIPSICSCCGRSFWLEPYKRSESEQFSPFGGFRIVVTDICRECVENERTSGKGV